MDLLWILDPGKLHLSKNLHNSMHAKLFYYIHDEVSRRRYWYLMGNHLLSVGVEAGVGKTFSGIFPEKPAIGQAYMVNFVARAATVQAMPVFRRCLPLPANSKQHRHATHKKHLLSHSLGHNTKCPSLSPTRNAKCKNLPSGLLRSQGFFVRGF